MNNMEYLLGTTMGDIIDKIKKDSEVSTFNNGVIVSHDNNIKPKTKIIQKRPLRRNYGKH